MVDVAQRQSTGLWNRWLRVQPPSSTQDYVKRTARQAVLCFTRHDRQVPGGWSLRYARKPIRATIVAPYRVRVNLTGKDVP
jgi:hypothetical protein